MCYIERCAIGKNQFDIATDIDTSSTVVITVKVRIDGDIAIHHIPAAGEFMVAAGELFGGMGL